ncbi:MAG TPA: NAD-dependent epimerase/dehydratase family protein [Stellaceae bacterium]|nr:NAD-dependent epimerase/dehydratase family protein [Stellaceae bacterium]
MSADLERAYKGARVLVAGGLGFIGSALAHRLVALGAEVAIVDALDPEGGGSEANIADIRSRVRPERADLRDGARVAPLLAGCSHVFNLAGRTSHMGSLADPLADLGANTEAALALLELVRARAPGAAILYASTRQVYGAPERLPVDETHPLHPPDPNAVAKIAGESYHLLYHRLHGLGATVLRLTNVYGPRMRIKDARQNFLGLWVRRVLEGAPVEVWGGTQRRDLAYVDDVVDAFLVAAARGGVAGRAYNVGGAPAVSLAELARLIVAANGGGRIETRDFPPERRAIDIGDYETDDRLFRETTGWSPRVELGDGLARTLEFFRPRLKDYL